MSVLNLGIIGCGNIAVQYLESVKRYPNLNIVSLFDKDGARAQKLAADNGLRAARKMEDILADRTVDMVVNLTPPQSHFEVISKALAAGKHVYTEKPMCGKPEECREVAAEAKRLGLRLFSAPITVLGDAQSEVIRLVKSGELGDIRFVTAEIHNGFIETWHPEPEAFYEVGPIFDVGLYPIMHMLFSLGRVTKIKAMADIVCPDRKRLDGRAFSIRTPDYITAHLCFENGAHGRLSASYVVTEPLSHSRGLEYHGTKGVAHLAGSYEFNTDVLVLKFREESGNDSAGTQDFVSIKKADWFDGIDWARGLLRIEEIINHGAEDSLPIDLYLHGMEVLFGIRQAYESGREVFIK